MPNLFMKNIWFVSNKHSYFWPAFLNSNSHINEIKICVYDVSLYHRTRVVLSEFES